MPLNPRQQAFCLEYVKDWNATQAAIRAGYSEKTAAQIGEQNLRKLEIASRIAEMQKQFEQNATMTAQELIERNVKIARLNIFNLYYDNGGNWEVKAMDEIPYEMGEFIDEIEIKNSIRESKDGKELSRFQQVKIKITPRNSAHERLGKWLGLENRDSGLSEDERDALRQAAAEQMKRSLPGG